MKNIQSLFNPKSIAIIGASQNPSKLGYALVRNIVEYDFDGEVYPINPNGSDVFGMKIYPSIESIENQIDLALVSIPNKFVLQEVEKCGRLGVKSAVILSSGFGEAGAEGKEIEINLRHISEISGMRILGPNCMGIYNIHGKLNATYFWELPKREGNVSFISQSGAYGGIFFNKLRKMKTGISKFISIGNMIDVDYSDIIEFLENDDKTDVVAIFIEGIKDGERFLKTARNCSMKKPIIAFKAGRTGIGKRAAMSHTGSLAGSVDTYEAAFRQSGVISRKDTDEFFDVIHALSIYSKNLPNKNSVALITISGGPSVIAGDACEEMGIRVPKLRDATRKKIRKLIPAFGADSNPVDMTPQMNPDNYKECVQTVFSDDQISGVIAINVGLDNISFANAFVQSFQKYKKPVLSFAIDTEQVSDSFNKNNIPIYPTPERCVKAYRGLIDRVELLRNLENPLIRDCSNRTSKVLRELTQYSDGQHLKPLSRDLEPVERNALTEYESKRVFSEYGIPVCREKLVSTIDEALRASKEIGFPVAAKICSTAVLHKTDSSGIYLNIRNEDELEDAFWRLKKKFGQGSQLLIQEMVDEGTEIIIGASRDPVFGPYVIFGLGGILTELLKDVSIGICPINKSTAMDMIESIKGYELLKGYRGKHGCDVDNIADVIINVSDLMLGNEEILELDINPLIVHEQQLVAVDGLIVLETN